jgi:hypothetical protein
MRILAYEPLLLQILMLAGVAQVEARELFTTNAPTPTVAARRTTRKVLLSLGRRNSDLDFDFAFDFDFATYYFL